MIDDELTILADYGRMVFGEGTFVISGDTLPYEGENVSMADGDLLVGLTSNAFSNIA